jgi:exosortase H (IPTLxxWG-CTERM-specific)
MGKVRNNTSVSTWQLNITTRLAVTFGIWFVALFALATILPESKFEPLNRHTAEMTTQILSLCGFHPVLVSSTLNQDGFAVNVVTECSVLYMGILFISFVAAYPAVLKQKLIGLAAGIPVLHLGNILRIAVVFAVGVKERSLFEYVHVYLGQVLMVLFVIAVCLVWARMLLPDPRDFRPTAFIVRVIACSTIPFLAWLAYNRHYVQLTDNVVYWLFSFGNIHFRFDYQHEIYYQTFNLVTFAGLVLSTRFRLVKRKLLALTTGIAIIVGMHLLFRICNGLMITSGMRSAYTLSGIINIVGQYLLPIVLWFATILKEDLPAIKPPKKKKRPYLLYRWPYTSHGEG